MKKSRLGKNAILNLTYNVIGLIFPFLVASYLARVLLPEGVGLASYISNVAGYFVTIAPLGITTYGIKAIAQCKNLDERSSVFSELILTNAVSTVFVSAIYLLMIGIFPYFREYKLLYVIAGIRIFSNIINVEWLYRGLEEYSYITVRNVIIKIISTIAIFLFVKTREDLCAYLIITCGISSCNNLFNILHSRKYVKFMIPPNIKRMVSYLRPLLTILVSEMAGEIYLKMDITMLGVLTSNENVGYYSSALRLVNMVLVAVTSVTAVSLPQLSQMFCCDDKSDFNRLIENLLRIILTISIPACMGLSLVSKDIVAMLFGTDFLATYSVLIILSFLFIIKGTGDLLCYQVVIATGSEGVIPCVRISSVALNFILNYVLIRKFQHNGAALATVITELFTFIVVVYLIRDKIHINLNRLNLMMLLLSSVCMTVGIRVIQRCISNSLLRLIGSIVVGVVIYFSVLLIGTKKFCIIRKVERKK